MTRTRTLRPAAPYDFAAAARYVAQSAAHVLETVDQRLTYRRALVLEGRAVLVSLRSTGSVNAPALEMAVSGEVVDPSQLDAAERFATRVFSLDADPTPFLERLAGEPRLRPLAASFGALRPVLLAGAYESLIWAVLGQQVTTRLAATLKRALVDRVGRELRLDGTSYALLPDPEAVAALTVDELRQLRLSRQKASYVQGLSRAVAEGELDLGRVAKLDAQAAVGALTAHRGVGRWTAECVLMRGLGRSDVIPAADVALRQWTGRALGREGLAAEADVRALARSVEGYEGWLAFAVWDALQRERSGQKVAPY